MKRKLIVMFLVIISLFFINALIILGNPNNGNPPIDPLSAPIIFPCQFEALDCYEVIERHEDKSGTDKRALEINRSIREILKRTV